METRYDEQTLSSYVDGELDVQTTWQVAEQVSRDPEAVEFILGALKSNALMKSMTRENRDMESEKRIADSLVVSVEKKEEPARIFHYLPRLAAGVMIAFLGFGAASVMHNSKESATVSLTPTIPESYSYIVNSALENDKSGVSRYWQSPGSSSQVTVTPIKTYRDSKGRYLRHYKLEISDEGQQQKVIGLAYRSADMEWKTKSLVFVNGRGAI